MSKSLSNDRPACVYAIDREDRPIFCNEQWDVFARENAGDDVVFERVEGRLLWNYVADPSTSDLYMRLVSHVRGGRTVKFSLSLRCDSPDVLRLLEMEIAPAPNGRVRFETRVKSVEHRDPNAASRAEIDAPLLICSWCGRVKIQELIWQDVDVAVNQLRIFERQFAPAISHGIRPDCYLCIADLIANAD